MGESAVAPAMAGDVGGGAVADGLGRRAPEIARVVVMQIECLSRIIGDRVVRPGGKLILPAIDRPGVTASLGGHLEPEQRVGDDVDPRCRRGLTGAEDRHIGPSAVAKAAKSVKEFEIRRRWEDSRRYPGAAPYTVRGTNAGGLFTDWRRSSTAACGDAGCPAGVCKRAGLWSSIFLPTLPLAGFDL